MSLINEALQRAKQVQQTNPPAVPNLQFRPAEPVQEKQSHGWLFLLLGVAILAISAVLVMTRTGGEPIASSSEQDEAPAAVWVETIPQAPVDIPEPEMAAATPVAEVTESPVLEPVPGVETPPPAPPAPRLQAIIYNAARPSAMIDGKIVFVNSRFGEFRVAGITQDTVTMAGESETLLLTLE